MRWAGFLAATLLMTSLAGCLGTGADPQSTDEPTGSPSGDPTPPSTSPSPAPTSASPSPSSSPTPDENTDPMANLVADVSSGEAPLAVLFTLDGTDEDGDALTWSFDPLGDSSDVQSGEELPATVEYTYESAGLYVAKLVVSDGQADAESTVEINVTAAVPDGPTGPPTLYFVGDGSTTVVADPATAQPNPNDPVVSNFGLASAGNAAQETTFTHVMSWNVNSDENPFIPTFVGNQPVTLSGGPIQVHAFIMAASTHAALGCGVLAVSIFDSEGTVVATADAPGIPTSAPDVSEVVVEITEVTPGEYAYLKVQVNGNFVDCDAGVFQWYWGTDEYNGRLVLGANDVIGPAPA